MRLLNHLIRLVVIASVCAPYAGSVTFAQQPQPRPNQGADVVHVNTELVQTDVMVFSKDGAFVEGLKREQFELKVDGRPREISFFERVAAGSRNEEAQLAAARGVANPSAAKGGAPVPLDRGRAVFFFLDDIHLSASSISQARALLTSFIDHEIGQNDVAEITSASGQIGFLQQLTDNKAVLRAAVARIKTRPSLVLDAERPPMTEYQALLVSQNDPDVLGYFIDEMLRGDRELPRQIAGDVIRARASQMLLQSAHLTTASLASLEAVVRSAGQLTGRKVLFLISDGFFLDRRDPGAIDRMRSITSAAARSGIVIYSIDARGLVASTNDPSGTDAVDPTPRLQRASGGELTASQDGLNALARDTGGRALMNTNALSAAVTTALKETSAYYLVAWRPDNDEQRHNGYKRIDVNIIGRPELSIRVRRNFGRAETSETAAPTRSNPPVTPKTAASELREALRATYPKDALPTALALYFLNLVNAGTVLAASMKITVEPDAFSVLNGKQTAFIDVAGVVFDDQGKSAGSFQDKLTISARSAEVQLKRAESLTYSHRVTLKPGLYQVRVAARDQKGERTGSATRWIEVPDLAAHQLALSSIIAGERTASGGAERAVAGSDKADGGTPPDTVAKIQLNVEHRFAHTSLLRFIVFAYNAATGDAAGAAVTEPLTKATSAMPDLAVQIQLLRDNEPVMTKTLQKIETDGIADLTRLPYAAEIPLQDLPVGRYLLKVTVIDRIAKTTASQQLDFQVD
jgi:VWFA-related protein